MRDTLNSEGFIVETAEPVSKGTFPNPPVQSSPPALGRSWPEVVDLTSPPIVSVSDATLGSDVSGAAAPKPQRAGPSRGRSASTSAMVLKAVTRKPTQPSRIPGSKCMNDKNKVKKPPNVAAQEDMDTSESGTRKRKNAEDLENREGKHATT